MALSIFLMLHKMFLIGGDYMNSSLDNSIGFLVVTARTANGSIPLENALVNIYENKNDGSAMANGYLLYTLKTNSLGQTEKIALPTKNSALSLSPGNERPFYSYNIFVSSEGYFDSDVINVPIFQGITSIQPVNLIPVSEYSSPNDFNPSYDSRFVEIPNTDL